MSNDPWGGNGAGNFFAGHLLNAGAEDFEDVRDIIGSIFHLVVSDIQIPFQMRGTISLVHLEKSGKLKFFFGFPHALLRINNEVFSIFGVEKKSAKMPEWKLLTKENGYFKTINKPQIEFSILKRRSGKR